MNDQNPIDSLKYPNLNLQQKEIRILKVDPDLSPDGLVQCHLYVATMFDGHLALSYTWGPPLPCKNVLINNTRFTVREKFVQFPGHRT